MNYTKTCLQIGQVLWLANHWSMQQLQKECRPSQSSCFINLPTSNSSRHTWHWSPTWDSSALNCRNCSILSGESPLLISYNFTATRSSNSADSRLKFCLIFSILFLKDLSRLCGLSNSMSISNLKTLKDSFLTTFWNKSTSFASSTWLRYDFFPSKLSTRSSCSKFRSLVYVNYFFD